MSPDIMLTIAKKEWQQIRRDTFTLLISVWMPFVLLLLFGTAITLDIRNIAIGALDQDNSQLSREMLFRITSGGYFVINKRLSNPEDIDYELNSGGANLAVWIPEHFSENLKKGRNPSLLVLMDGSDNNTAGVALGYFQTLLQGFLSEMNKGNLPVDVKDRVWFNPELKSTDFLIPGLIGIIMMITCTTLTALSIVKEKERGTIEKLMVAPVKPVEFIIGKILPYSIIAFVDFLIIFLGGIFIFGMPFNGSLLLLLVLSVLFIAVGLSYGLFISSLTGSQQIAWMVSLLTTLLPSMILSGFLFLISSMPYALQAVTYLVPARYIISILRGIILKGNGGIELLPHILPLIILCTGFIYGSSIMLRKRPAG
ncbi:MAG TPA: ABC transporter permease [bacterium]